MNSQTNENETCICGHEKREHIQFTKNEFLSCNHKDETGYYCPCKKFKRIEYIACRDCRKKVQRTGRSHAYCNDCIKKRDLGSKYRNDKKNKFNPEKRRRKVVNTIAQRNVKIPKGQICEDCNISSATERHHKDYSKPLEVRFLCRNCHNKLRPKRYKK